MCKRILTEFSDWKSPDDDSVHEVGREGIAPAWMASL